MALMRHQQRIKNYTIDEINQPELGAAEPALHSLKSTWFRWMMAASIGIILILSSIFFKEELLFKTYSTEFGETSSITLKDGSQVTLNANSMLRVPRFGFGQKTREVVLVGEADFSIKHMPDHQHFVVQTNKNFEVVVLGTEFLVNTRETGKKVVLNKGKVRLLYQEGKISKQLTMKPGNLVTFDNEGRVRVKQTPKPRDFTAWKEHRFVFDGTTLAEISNLFAQNYGITLQIPDRALTQWTISGAFTAYSADELLETLASASNLRYKRHDKTIVITQEH
eukprot:TRINITY_DN10137_c0_g1_i1.p1 TRINITY_DN10137_c0_g1~~TRINITY_DN10137_c0_g1_i1.p1  ORF type:complete len:329 (-),score=11.26 TRINITY_DN10137_c0_g1_i1:34-873(-)